MAINDVVEAPLVDGVDDVTQIHCLLEGGATAPSETSTVEFAFAVSHPGSG